MFEKEIEPFLPGQAADDAKQKRIRRGLQTKAPLQGRLVGRPVLQNVRLERTRNVCVKAAGDVRVCRRIPYRSIHPVEDSAEVTCSFAQETAKPHAALVAEDLPGIGRGDRRDTIGKIQTGLQEPDLSIVFDTVNVERLRWQTDRSKHLARKHTLIGKVVNRHQRGWAR